MRTFFLVLLALLVQGCVHRQTVVPPGWSLAETIPTGKPATTPSHEPAAMQIFICYGDHISSHAAMRLTDGSGKVVFWDPGGGYGADSEQSLRVASLIPNDPPTPTRYFAYRSDTCSEDWMEMYEWNLDPQEARALQTMLITGESERYPGPLFESDVAPMSCARAICAFLNRFRPRGVQVTKLRFWPDELGQELWSQRPDRVVEFRKDAESRVYVWVGEQEIDPVLVNHNRHLHIDAAQD